MNERQQKELSERIEKMEQELTELRNQRREAVKQGYAEGLSKYRLAKQWGISENTVTRMLTGKKL